jgi:hypothetical protein
VKKIKYLMLETQVVRMSHYLPRKRLRLRALEILTRHI